MREETKKQGQVWKRQSKQTCERMGMCSCECKRVFLTVWNNMCCFSNNCAFLHEYVSSLTVCVRVCLRSLCVSKVCISQVSTLCATALATLHSLDHGQLADRLPELPGLNS